jgi:hypothetical protein
MFASPSTAVAAGACVVLLPAFAFDSYASAGTRIEAVDSLALLCWQSAAVWSPQRSERQRTPRSGGQRWPTLARPS